MPPIPVGFGQASFVFEGLSAGPGGAMITLGLDHPFDENPTVLAQELFDAYTTNILPAQTQTVDLVEVRLRIASPAGEIVFSYFQVATGGDTSESLTPNTSWPITKFTSLGGRANKGRWFLPGMPSDIVDDAGTIENSAVTAMNLQLGGFLVDLAAADFTPVILHSVPEGGVPPPPDPTPIVSFACGTKVYTRGSRLRS